MPWFQKKFVNKVSYHFDITCTVGWPKMSKTSKTEKYLWDTKFSHYLGQKHDRNAKKIKFYEL